MSFSSKQNLECILGIYFQQNAYRTLRSTRIEDSVSPPVAALEQPPAAARTPGAAARPDFTPLGNYHYDTTTPRRPPLLRVVLCRGQRVCILLFLGTACINHQPSGNSRLSSPHTACAGRLTCHRRCLVSWCQVPVLFLPERRYHRSEGRVVLGWVGHNTQRQCAGNLSFTILTGL